MEDAGTLQGKWRTFLEFPERTITVTTEFAGSRWSETTEAIDFGKFEDSDTIVLFAIVEWGTFTTDTAPLFDEIDMIHDDLPEYGVFRTAEGIRGLRALIATAEDDDEVDLGVEDIEALAFSLSGIAIDIPDLLERAGIYKAEYRVLTGRMTESELEMAEDTIRDVLIDFVTKSIQKPGAPRFGIYEFDRSQLQLELADVRPREFAFEESDTYSRIY